MKINKNTLFVIVAFLLMVFIIANITTCIRKKREIQHYQIIDSEMTKTKNSKNEELARIQSLEVTNEKQLLKLKSKDSTIVWLQSVVKDYKGKLNTAVVFSNHSTSAGGTTTIIYDVDTIVKDSIVYLYPVYSTHWNTKWEIGNITANKDTIFRDIKIINEYEITLGKPKTGLFKKKTQEVSILNKNPNTTTTELRSVEVVHQPKLINIGFQLGYGVHGSGFTPGPYIGFGLNVNPFRLKN